LGQTKDNKDLSIKLLRKIIDSIGYNPSSTLDNICHREDPPLLDKILSMVNLRKNKNTDQFINLLSTAVDNKFKENDKRKKDSDQKENQE